MDRSSDFDRDRLIQGLVRIEPEPVAQVVPREYLNAVSEMLKYLMLYSAKSPDIPAMSKEDRQRYVLGYALPFMRARIPAETFWRLGPDNRGGAPGEALIRWTERPGDAWFPMKPGQLVEICEVVLKDRAPGWKPTLALDSPPPSREERNRQRVRLGLDPLPEPEA